MKTALVLIDETLLVVSLGRVHGWVLNQSAS